MPGWVWLAASCAFGCVGAVCSFVVVIAAVSALLFVFAVFCHMSELIAFIALGDVEFRCVFLRVVELSFDGHASL